MLRLILLILLGLYLLHKLGFFTALIQAVNGDDRPRQPKDSNMHVDPNTGSSRKATGYKGGEYIDYEEVKDNSK